MSDALCDPIELNFSDNKKKIARAFSSSASTYNQFATLQQAVGAELIEVMLAVIVEDENRRYADVLLDVGCGTGFFTHQLIEQCGVTQYIGVDLAQGMLDVAQANNQLSFDPVEFLWLCDDAENLSLADESVDIIYANFSLQWCENLPALMASFSRVLKPNGLCCFTSLDVNSLYELRQSWAAVNELRHVNHFFSADKWREAIQNQGLTIVDAYQKKSVSYYHSVRELLQSLKAIGANTVLGKRQQGLMSKANFQQLITAYEHYRQPQGLPVSYIVDGWILQK